MFSTCLFCHTSLDANQSSEHFPIGRRLAFDAERGRLWAVCPNCARWSLTPLEERWEAIEERERVYRDTKQRVSTDNIALARLKDGTDLVRIGRPLLPEFSAWRYGDQLGRRRKRHRLRNVFAGGSMTTMYVAATSVALLGMVTNNAIAPHVSMLMFSGGLAGGAAALLWECPLAHEPLLDGGRAVVHPYEVNESKLSFHEDGTLQFTLHARVKRRFWIPMVTSKTRKEVFAFSGDDARLALGAAIVAVNHEGTKPKQVQAAVREIESGADSLQLIRGLVDYAGLGSDHDRGRFRYGVHQTPEKFLALEMLLHEEEERRALAGELGALYTRWEEAERVAGIADGELSTLPGADPR